MIYGSVCSGIEGASVAWHRLGWRPAFFSEIEKFPRAVLAQHYPEVPLHGDFTTIDAGRYEPIDLLVGGTPCQSFSVAGLRGGLADDRGNLALEYLRLAQRLRSQWLVWENVPGVFSSTSHDAPDPCEPPPPMDMERDGQEVGTEDDYDSEEVHAFNCVLAGFSELGYGFAYRTLDAQYFGVPQRRRRVFVVGYLGDWRPAAAVLFERESLSGDPAPRREARQRTTRGFEIGPAGGRRTEVAPTLDARAKDGPIRNQIAVGDSHCLAFGGNNTSGPIDVATARSGHGGPHGRCDFETETFVAHALRADGFDASEDGTSRGTPLGPAEWPFSGAHPPAVAFSCKDYGADATASVPPTLRAMGHDESHANAGGQLAVTVLSAVRRLTPRECERLQGFPDDYSLISFRGKPASDGPRYKALGNSMAVPCMAWIGRRIDAVSKIVRAV